MKEITNHVGIYVLENTLCEIVWTFKSQDTIIEDLKVNGVPINQ